MKVQKKRSPYGFNRGQAILVIDAQNLLHYKSLLSLGLWGGREEVGEGREQNHHIFVLEPEGKSIPLILVSSLPLPTNEEEMSI